MKGFWAVVFAGLCAGPLFAQTPKRYIVGFAPGATASQRAGALKALGATSVEKLDELDALVAEIPEGDAGVSAMSDRVRAQTGLAAVEEDVYVRWLSADAAFDTPARSASPVWRAIFTKSAEPAPAPAGSAPAEIPWGIARVDAPAAWAKTQGEGVRVAVVDTGIDSTHPDLAANYAGGYNALDSGSSPFDDNGHGTHVAGTIAAAWDGKGVVGVAPKARLFAVKVLDKDGGAHLTSIMKGLVWCAKNNIQVANMSLGAPIGSLFMHLAVKYAASKGVVLVAAAGNSGRSVEYPARYDDVIAVAASDSSDHIADFSSRGSKVEFIAPGVDVRSTVPGGLYETMSGTSMATPHVTGLAALAVARGASGVDQVRAVLKKAAKPLGLAPAEQGAGLIDAALIGK